MMITGRNDTQVLATPSLPRAAAPSELDLVRLHWEHAVVQVNNVRESLRGPFPQGPLVPGSPVAERLQAASTAGAIASIAALKGNSAIFRLAKGGMTMPAPLYDAMSGIMWNIQSLSRSSGVLQGYLHVGHLPREGRLFIGDAINALRPLADSLYAGLAVLRSLPPQ